MVYTPPLRPAEFKANAPPLSPPALHALSLAPLPHELAPFLLPHSTLSPTEKRQLFTANFLKSAANGDADTLEWLCSIPTLSPRLSHSRNQSRNAARYSTTSLSSLSPFEANQAIRDIDDSSPRKWCDLEARDDQGNTALVLCVNQNFIPEFVHHSNSLLLLPGCARICRRIASTRRSWCRYQRSRPLRRLDRSALGSSEQRFTPRFLPRQSSSLRRHPLTQRTATERSRQTRKGRSSDATSSSIERGSDTRAR